MVTPREVVVDVVRAATGSTPRRLERIIAGRACEVYDAGEVIVRISHESQPRFAGERWALDAARAAGVPTPQVLLVDGGFCVEEKLPGERLDVVLRDRWPGRAIEQLGDLLGRIHSVPMDGFGYVQSDGRGTATEFPLLDVLGEHAALNAIANSCDIDVDRAVATLRTHAPAATWPAPCLVHGDFTMDNVLVDGDRVSGLIDMEKAAGSHWADDLMMWDSCCRGRIPLELILASYPRQAFDAEFDLVFHLLLLRWSLRVLIIAHHTRDRTGVEYFRGELARAMQFFC